MRSRVQFSNFHFSSRACGARVSVICDSDDMHFLHIRHHDAGRSNIFGARLGANVLVHFGAIFAVFSVHVRDARITAMAAGEGKIGRSTEHFGNHGTS